MRNYKYEKLRVRRKSHRFSITFELASPILSTMSEICEKDGFLLILSELITENPSESHPRA